MRLDHTRPNIRADKTFLKEEHFLADKIVAGRIIHPADDVGKGRRSQGRVHAPKLRGTEPPGRAARSLIGRHIRRLDKEERACDVEQRAIGELLGRGSAETHHIRQRCTTERREAAQVTFGDKRLFGRHIRCAQTRTGLRARAGRGGGQQQREGRKVVRGGDQGIRGLVHHRRQRRPVRMFRIGKIELEPRRNVVQRSRVAHPQRQIALKLVDRLPLGIYRCQRETYAYRTRAEVQLISVRLIANRGRATHRTRRQRDRQLPVRRLQRPTLLRRDRQ